jgi:hypothetical protein
MTAPRETALALLADAAAAHALDDPLAELAHIRAAQLGLAARLRRQGAGALATWAESLAAQIGALRLDRAADAILARTTEGDAA